MAAKKHLARKEKLWRLASDVRGNEHERRVAELAYQKLCAEEVAGSTRRFRKRAARHRSQRKPKSPKPLGQPEFNKLERALIALGAALVVGAGLIFPSRAFSDATGRK